MFKFHNAANEASFTLCALRSLGIKVIGEESSDMAERVGMLWWIAMGDVVSRKKRKNVRRK